MSDHPPCPAAPRAPLSAAAAQLSSPMARSRPARSPAPAATVPEGGGAGEAQVARAGVPLVVSDRRGSPPVPSPSGFPVRCRGPGDGEIRPQLPDHRWRRLAEGLGLGPGFPRPETPRSEQRQGARRMWLSRGGGERAERTLIRDREQAKRSFALGPGGWRNPAPGLCPRLDEISAP